MRASPSYRAASTAAAATDNDAAAAATDDDAAPTGRHPRAPRVSRGPHHFTQSVPGPVILRARLSWPPDGELQNSIVAPHKRPLNVTKLAPSHEHIDKEV